jgi:hypothetical protein
MRNWLWRKIGVDNFCQLLSIVLIGSIVLISNIYDKIHNIFCGDSSDE